MEEQITLSRDCEANRIPSGEKLTLPAGSKVVVTQSLGGAYTVITDAGHMVRIAAKDVEALGKTPPPNPQAGSTAPGEALTTEQLQTKVWDELRSIFDPEIPVNIVDLGLVYNCQVTPLPVPGAGHTVEITMTLTAPGCGMGDVLRADAENKIRSLPDITDVNVQIVVEPPWNQTMMSEGAKLQLGLL